MPQPSATRPAHRTLLQPTAAAYQLQTQVDLCGACEQTRSRPERRRAVQKDLKPRGLVSWSVARYFTASSIASAVGVPSPAGVVLEIAAPNC